MKPPFSLFFSVKETTTKCQILPCKGYFSLGEDKLYVCKGLFTWREEVPSTRKILEGEANFLLVYILKFRSGWLLEFK